MSARPELVAQRDRRAWFEEEVSRLLPELYGSALRLTGEAADAEDLVADAVTKAWESLEQLRDPDAFRSWMHHILSNAFASRRRKPSARAEVQPLPDAEEESGRAFSIFERLHQPFLLWWSDPEQAFLNRLLREHLRRALDTLPEKMRLVIVLCDLQGMKYREIAETLDVPIGTVRSRLSRARSRLQRALWAEAVDAGLVGPGGPEGERA